MKCPTENMRSCHAPTNFSNKKRPQWNIYIRIEGVCVWGGKVVFLISESKLWSNQKIFFKLLLFSPLLTRWNFCNLEVLNKNKIFKLSETSPNFHQNSWQIISKLPSTNTALHHWTFQGKTMLCLPQAFELFLKHLVGGLHTVYTKCKRLDINPLVCNVEQVRVLRGLGAIQPGVNRCKLLSDCDFDELYKDCTTQR